VVEDVAADRWTIFCLGMEWSVVMALTVCVVFYSLTLLFALSCCYRLGTMVFLWYKSGCFGPFDMHLIHSNPHIVHSHLITTKS
jgi:succinate-acetate transporter protein